MQLKYEQCFELVFFPHKWCIFSAALHLYVVI